MSRLPVPDWGRDGETWRVEGEPNMEAIPAKFSGLCDTRLGQHQLCNQLAVARTRRGEMYFCDRHLRESLMWVEDAQVVSWRLSR